MKYINPKRVSVSNDEFMVTGIDPDSRNFNDLLELDDDGYPSRNTLFMMICADLQCWAVPNSDELLTHAEQAHECTVERDGALCGWPLDDDGLCPEHE